MKNDNNKRTSGVTATILTRALHDIMTDMAGLEWCRYLKSAGTEAALKMAEIRIKIAIVTYIQ